MSLSGLAFYVVGRTGAGKSLLSSRISLPKSRPNKYQWLIRTADRGEPRAALIVGSNRDEFETRIPYS